MNLKNLLFLLASISMLLFLSFSLTLVSASLNVQLSDQGTGVAYNNGTILSSGNLTILIYAASSGGSPIYNKTFINNISDGSWNVMLGSGGTDLPLEFGKVYYKDYLIAGENAQFDGSDRQAFYSPLGDINGSDLATDFYINTVGHINTTGNVSVGTILFDGSVNQTLSVNSTSIYYYNGTSWIDLTSGSGSVFTGANVTANGTQGLVPKPLANQTALCLLSNGSWGDCGDNYWARNATTNITSLANSQDNVNLTSSNITTTGTGFFVWLGSLASKITKIWTTSLNVNNTIEFRDENHSLSANDTTIYYFNGSDYIDLASEGDNYWSRNATTNITSLANIQDNVNLSNNLTVNEIIKIGATNISSTGNVDIAANVTVGGTVKVTNDLNMTSNNLTTVDCVLFISGGKICNSP